MAVREIRWDLPPSSQHALIFWYWRNPLLYQLERLYNLQTTDAKKPRSFERGFLIMAGVERFELPTRGFGIRCSANWSYTPVVRV